MGRTGCLELEKVVTSPCSLGAHQPRGGVAEYYSGAIHMRSY